MPGNVTPNTDRTVSRTAGTVADMENNEERMRQWCRMWNEDPALAHELMSPTCVQWSGQTPGLDSVVGPAEQVRFLEGYRGKHINIFRPRVLADGGDHFAYLWDVDKADGRKLTGFDVNILHGGGIAENWTFVGSGATPRPTRRTPPATTWTKSSTAGSGGAPASRRTSSPGTSGSSPARRARSRARIPRS